MGPKVQQLITDAMKYGSELPAAMKPMIQAWIDAGRLTDENGQALSDLSRLTFAQDLSKMFETLIDKLDQFIDKVTNGVGGALDGIGSKVVNPKVIIDVETRGSADPATVRKPGSGIIRDDAGNILLGGSESDYGGSGGWRGDVYYATGGIVQPEVPIYAQTGRLLQFAPKSPSKGSDTIDAKLSPGEGVVTPSGMEELTAARLRMLNERPGEFTQSLIRQDQPQRMQNTLGQAPPPQQNVQVTYSPTFDFSGAHFGSDVDVRKASKIAAEEFFAAMEHGQNRTKLADLVQQLQSSREKLRRTGTDG
jgi:hypothetical protein